MVRKLSDLAVGEEPEVGTNYLVPCLDLRDVTFPETIPQIFRAQQHRMTAIPVIGTIHTDPEFPLAGGERPHIHVDIRFLTEWEAVNMWGYLWGAKQANNPDRVMFAIIPCDPTEGILLPAPHLHEKICARRIADFRAIIIGGNFYGKFEDEMAKHRLKLENPICPHHGTPLKGQPVRDGVITCPLHGSNWCARTGEFRRKTKDYRYLGSMHPNYTNPETAREITCDAK